MSWGNVDNAAFGLRKALSRVFVDYRAAALVPLVILGLYGLGGVEFMVIGAALLPVLIALLVATTRTAETLAETDDATGLAGIEAGEAWVERHMFGAPEPAGAIAVMSVTVDELETLEARVGRPMLDLVLSEAAERFARLVRQDDLIVRADAGNFLICLSDIKSPETDNLMQMAHRLKATLNDPFERGAVRVFVTISVGIARLQQVSPKTPRALIAAAEDANANATNSGPGAVRIYKSSAGTRQSNDRDLTGQIAEALESGEIVGWYQPQISTDTGKVTGFEALARWEHPTRGLISPATFLDIIDRSGLSQRLAEVVLSHSLSALRTWDKAKLGVPAVAVNFSNEELRNPRLPDYVAWELDRHEIAASRLGIEVLESVIADSPDDIVARNLRRIADMGCRIDLDDFGTGYTSIINIRRFAVSRIKIDRRLVSRVDTDRDQQDLVASLLAMAERLGVETLGEGVETQAELAMLAQLGAHHVQGFSVARPMPLGDTLTWLQTQQDNSMFQSPPIPGTRAEGRLR